MKVNLQTIQETAFWEKAGVRLPRFDVSAMREATNKAPVWVHFGAGNIFRAYIAVSLSCSSGCWTPGCPTGGSSPRIPLTWTTSG